MRFLFSLTFLFFLFLISCNSQPNDFIEVDLSSRGLEVSPIMYSLFFEEINHAGDGGLYAEMVKSSSFEEPEMPEGYRADDIWLVAKKGERNITGGIADQTFQWTTEEVHGWGLNTDRRAVLMKLSKENPKFSTAPNNLKITIKDSSLPISLINEGYWGWGSKKVITTV